MSDTVKVIIEIPKPMYESVQNGTYCGTLYKELKNGIPLDDVKAEIEKKCDRINSIASVLSYPQHREIQELLCEILDNIGKAESEVKPNESLIKDCCEAQGHLWADNNIFEDVEENQ